MLLWILAPKDWFLNFYYLKTKCEDVLTPLLYKWRLSVDKTMINSFKEWLAYTVLNKN